MKKNNLLILYFILLIRFSYSQNLIINPSFESGTPAYSTAIIPASWPNLKGLWTFDNTSSPLVATVGNNLTLNGTHTTIAGYFAGDNAVRIGVGSNYKVTHGIPANGGGSYVNQYSILFDFRVSSIGAWRAFYQCNQNNTNDAELFVRNSDGMIGVTAVGYGAESVIPNVWHRLIISVNNGSFYKIYLDGRVICNGATQSVDGRFSLDPSIYFLSDDNGEDGLIDVSTIALFDKALSQTEVESLGRWTCDNWLGMGNYQQEFRNGGLPTAANGTFYLFAGSDTPLDAYQDVNVTPDAVAIDAGAAIYTFTGKLNTYNQSPQDRARIIIEYRNAGGTVLWSYDTGNQTTNGSWVSFVNTHTAPALTRIIRIRLLSTKNNGVSNDASYDDFSLTKLITLGTNDIDLKEIISENNSNKIQWEYEGNEKLNFFEVQKSFDLNNWESVTKLHYSNNKLYEFNDLQKYTTTYYRIKGINEKNDNIYSKIKAIEYSNPTNENLSLTFSNPVPANESFYLKTNLLNCNVYLYGSDGKLIDQCLSTKNYLNPFTINNCGLYSVVIENNKFTITKKLIVK
ncbi:MAG: hypothetical protein SFY56_11300 [Bacteroidota bacterium]|nr:hypothetical protein [Bacteroidota bacterium]